MKFTKESAMKVVCENLLEKYEQYSKKDLVSMLVMLIIEDFSELNSELDEILLDASNNDLIQAATFLKEDLKNAWN